MSLPVVEEEMLKWVHRGLWTVETYLNDTDFSYLKEGGRGPSIAGIVLYQFLEFVDDYHGVDLTLGSGEMMKDVYGRMVEQKYERLRDFYQTFKKRDSARREESLGDVPSEGTKKAMSTWAEGVK